MKSKTIISILLAVLLMSCDKYLDYNEQSFYDDSEDIFSNFSRTNEFLAGMYAKLPTDYSSVDGAMRSAACDEAEFTHQLFAVQDFNNGQWASSYSIDSQWSNFYSGIRSANVFLQEIENRLYEEYQYNDDYEDQMERFSKFEYEARFLRAFFYFELAKRYGDIPMPQGVVNDVDQINNITKTGFQDVISFITSECDAIEDSLHVSWADAGVQYQETGRVTRGAVLALKARALLYAASPLHNSASDVTKWEAAATAANEFLTNPELAYSFDGAYYNSSNMSAGAFNNRASSGLIFERRQGNSNSFERNNYPVPIEGASGYSTCPSQNLVDAYQTTDGYFVSLDGSGVWSAAGSTDFDPANPYANRDPRFLQTVIVNGSTWKGATIETFIGGYHGTPKAEVSLTGYYLKKYVRQDLEIAGSNTSSKEHTWVIFRLAEVYLNLAEAMNEAYGPTTVPAGFTMNAESALNMVRTRAAVGLPAVAGLSQDEFRSAIINERRVELAFEDHRFWDIRRWKLHDGANPDNVTEDIYGIEITNTNDVLSYSKKLVDDRLWDSKMYLYPIPYVELSINPNLGQNPGW